MNDVKSGEKTPPVDKSGHSFTPGPWAWFGSEHGFYLATTHSWRQHVMGFDRMGMNKAQPTFQVNGVMKRASDLAVFEVGPHCVVGIKAAKANGSGVYRTDITGFDHPDARLIAAAPELYEALSAMTEFAAEAWKDSCELNGWSHEEPERITNARAALARARGDV